MAAKRTIQIFAAGCSACEATVERVRELARPCCEIIVLDMHRNDVAQRAAALGIRSVPAVAIDGKLAACCAGRGPDEGVLRAAGVGQPLT